MGFKGIRLVALAVLVGSAMTVVTAAPVKAITWSYSCQTVYGDFKYDGGGYSKWGLTLRVQTGGCWTSKNTTWLEGTQSVKVTRWWANDGSLYKDGLVIAPPPAQSYSSVTAKYHVSAWYTSPCDPALPFLCIDYNAVFRQAASVQIHNSSNPLAGNWYFVSSCPFSSGTSWVTNCSMSYGTIYKSGIVATYV